MSFLLETLAPARKKAGRPRGSQGAVLADLSGLLTLEDFSFVRALVNGIDSDKAFRQYYSHRHFNSRGEGVVPHGLTITAFGLKLAETMLSAALLSGDELVAMMARRVAAIRFDQVKNSKAREPKEKDKDAPALPSLQEWMDSENVPDDYYTELDLIAMYEEHLKEFKAKNNIKSDASGADATEKRALMESQIQAINLLQNRLASLPQPHQAITAWVAVPLARLFIDLGVTTMQDLVLFISSEGRSWRKKIEGLGPVRAERLENWLDTNQATLGNIIREGVAWTARAGLRRKIDPLMDVSSGTANLLTYDSSGVAVLPNSRDDLRPRPGIAPLELIQVPPQLDGAGGLYRGPAVNHYGARTDLQAIRMWLASYLHAKKLATFDAYRREIERFYLWCLQEAQIPLSSVSLAHALGYQKFLQAITPKYITQERVTRDDVRWRPFRGQLDPKSQRYALNVVSQFFTAAHKNGYLSGNPFTSVKSAAVTSRDLDTSRSLSKADLIWLEEALADHIRHSPEVDHAGEFDLEAALRRRINLVFNIGLSTGFRREEITTATIAGMQPAVVNGEPDDSYWMLEVEGKGKRIRTVPISEQLRQMILAHHVDVRKMLAMSGSEASARAEKFERRPPLVCALRSPVGSKHALVTDEAVMANDNLSLSKVGLYRSVKNFFVSAAKPNIRQVERLLTDTANRMGVATAKSDGEAMAKLSELQQSLRRDLAMWTRRSSMSTHWMRHTFATGVLRDNPNDAGLKMAQQLLGHASIATTQVYLKVDDTDKARAILNLKPFG